MFHRVKSEGSESQTTDTIEQTVAEVSPKSQEEKSVFDDVSETASSGYEAANPYQSQSYLQVSNTSSDEESEKDNEDSVVTDTASAPAQVAKAKTYKQTTYTPSSSYTSPYARARTVAAASPSTDADSDGESKLTIGRGITMSGEIECCDHLYVEGTVEAALKGAKMLDIAESGVFYGTVEIEEATISGRFEGDLNVKGRLTVEATGIITGTISYGELQIEAGAIIDGRITPNAAATKALVKDAASSKDDAFEREAVAAE